MAAQTGAGTFSPDPAKITVTDAVFQRPCSFASHLSNHAKRRRLVMNDLLASVLEAHGGVARWARVRTVTARLSIGGPFWGRKGWPEIFGDQTMLELDARRQHIVLTPFNGADRHSTFDVNPERIVVHTNDGVVVERRDDPRASFAGYEVTTPWDALQVGYFISYACWNYLTAPFLFTYPGVETESSSRGRRTGGPGGVCTSRSRDRSPRTARSRSPI